MFSITDPQLCVFFCGHHVISLSLPVGSADLRPLLLQRVHRDHCGAVQRGLKATSHQMCHL